MRHAAGTLGLICLLTTGVAATVAPSSYLTVLWVDNQQQVEQFQRSFPGVILVERQRAPVAQGRVVGSDTMAPAARAETSQRERLGEVFFAPPEALLGLPPVAPAPARPDAPTP